MSEWYEVAGCGRSCTGATLSLLNAKAYMVGGTISAVPMKTKKSAKSSLSANNSNDGSKSIQNMSPWLQVDQMLLPSMDWVPVLVNSGGLLNRAYHASAGISSLENRIFTFGGIYTSCPDEIAHDVLEIETNSIFGIQASICTAASGHAATCSRGLSATVIGNDDAIKNIVLFGGCGNAQQFGNCNNAFWLFEPALATNSFSSANADIDAKRSSCYTRLTPIANPVYANEPQRADVSCPSARAFHACAVGGSEGQYLFLYGGIDNQGNVLDDLWMADLSLVLACLRRNHDRKIRRLAKSQAQQDLNSDQPEEQEEIEPDEEVKGDVIWTQLLAHSTVCGPRYLHSMYTSMTPVVEGSDVDSKIYVTIFGGSHHAGYASNVDTFTASIDLSTNLRNLQQPPSPGEPLLGPGVVSVNNTTNIENPNFDFIKNDVVISSKCSNFSGTAIATLSTVDVSCALVVAFNGTSGAVIVTDDTVPLSLATKKARIKHAKEAKAAAAAAAAKAQNSMNDKNASKATIEPEDNTKLPSKVNYPNGDHYEGELKLPADYNEGDPIVPVNLIRSGKGRMHYKRTGEVFEGLWQHNVRQGYGRSEVVVTATDVSFPEGGSATGYQNGNVFVSALGNSNAGLSFSIRYEGMFAQDKRCGEGQLYFLPVPQSTMHTATSHVQSQSSLTGQNAAAASASTLKEKDNRHSVSHAGTASGSVVGASDMHDDNSSMTSHKNRDTNAPVLIYSGQWAENQYNGTGELHYPNGSVYTGQFTNGQRHGAGSYVPVEANRQFTPEVSPVVGGINYHYTGDWQEDTVLGIGEVKNFPIYSNMADTTATQQIEVVEGIYEGPTKNGIPWGNNGYCAYKDGSEYLGEWKNGRKSGRGVQIAANLDTYDGKFVGNVRCGLGKLVTKAGDTYEGFWSNNREHGVGKRISATGIVSEGRFEQGEFKGL